jgi:hypothetical protein
MPLVRVASFPSHHEAELARLHLEAHDIGARLQDKSNIAAQGYGLSHAEVDVVVAREDAEEAVFLLEELGSTEVPPLEAEDGLVRPSDGADADAARAFRLAILGLFFLPVLSHLYCLIALRKIERGKLSKKGERQYRAAFNVSWLLLLLGGWAIVRFTG